MAFQTLTEACLAIYEEWASGPLNDAIDQWPALHAMFTSLEDEYPEQTRNALKRGRQLSAMHYAYHAMQGLSTWTSHPPSTQLFLVFIVT